MVFLIEYDRARGRVVKLSGFEDSAREQAEDARLALELRLNYLGVEREVVLLEASTEEALRHTHRRYFEDVAGLTRTPGIDSNQNGP